MTFFKTIALAFAMFSTIPMPKVEWSERNLRYLLCAFPLVGALIGFLWLLVDFAAQKMELASKIPFAKTALLTSIPVFVTGGIHLDGFCDTCDAISSHAERERKLEILKDSHCGAFALIFTAMYFLLYASFLHDIGKITAELCAVFVMERFLSALSVATFPLAKNSGLVHSFATAGARRNVAIFSAAGFILLSGALIALFGIRGVAIVAPCIVVFIAYYLFAIKEFGGITGDIAGAFLQMCEICTLASYCIVNSILS